MIYGPGHSRVQRPQPLRPGHARRRIDIGKYTRAPSEVRSARRCGDHQRIGTFPVHFSTDRPEHVYTYVDAQTDTLANRGRLRCR